MNVIYEPLQLGKRIRQTRKATGGMSRKQLAKCLKIAPHTITKWERGEQEPTFAHLVKLSLVLGVSIDYLTGIKDKWKAAKSVA